MIARLALVIAAMGLLALAPARAYADHPGAGPVQGVLDQGHLDTKRGPRTVWTLQAGELNLQLVLRPGVVLPSKLDGRTAVVRGTFDRAGRLVIRTRSQIRPLRGVPAARAQAGPVTGTRRVAVIMVKFANTPTPPQTAAYVNGRYFTDGDSAAAWYAEMSYGKLQLTGDVFGWYTISASSSPCSYSAWGNAGKAMAVAAGVDLTQYDHISYFFPANACSSAASGYGIVGGNTSWIFGNAVNTKTIVHELGHNFGLQHANSFRCTNGYAAVSISTSCVSTEYGDRTDPMGGGPDRHFSAYAKHKLGWLEEANVHTPMAGGTFTLEPISAASAGVQAIRIPRQWLPDAQGHRYLYLEYRTQRPFDEWSCCDSWDARSGVTVHLAPDAVGRPQLLDANIANATAGRVFLEPGQTMLDPRRNIRITTNSVGPAGASVTVQMNPDAPPTVPSSFRATATTGAVKLAWGASSDDVGLAQGYEVWRDGVQVASNLRVLSWTDTSISPGASYSYQVRANDGFQTSQTAALTVRTPPSQVQNLRTTSRTSTSVSLAWDVPTSAGAIVSYRLWRWTGVGWALAATVPTNSHNLSGLTPGTTVFYQVSAVNSYGAESQRSASHGASTDLVAPGAVGNLRVTKRYLTALAVAWNPAVDTAPGKIASYRVRWRVAPAGTWSAPAVVAAPGAAKLVTGLATNTPHEIEVTAIDQGGNEGPAATVTGLTDVTPPTTPVLSVGGATNSTLNLSWTASSDAVGVAGYNVYRYVGGRWPLVASLDAGQTSFQATGLLPGTTYSHFVRAVDTAGNLSGYISRAAATTGTLTAPPAPTGLAMTRTGASAATISWTPVSIASSYQVYRFSAGRWVLLGSPTTASFPRSGFASGVSYTYMVKALNWKGASPASASLTFTW